MRLHLLPISTRRTLIYCQKTAVAGPATEVTYVDKVTEKAANLWTKWEGYEKGWQKTVVQYGNKALQRIPYEEWGLKSIPPLTTDRQNAELSEKDKVEVIFPSSIIPEASVSKVLRTLGTERQALHKKYMIYSIIGMPISAPVALLPVCVHPVPSGM